MKVVYGSLIAVLIVLLSVYSFMATSKRINTMDYIYKPVSTVTHLYNVRQVGLLVLNTGDRVLVPHGEFVGIWRVERETWELDDEPVVGKKVYRLDTRESYTCHGDRWTSTSQDVLGDGRGYLNGNFEWHDMKYVQEDNRLVFQDTLDGIYNIVTEMDVYEFSVIDGRIYSELETDGETVILPKNVKAVVESI